MSDDRLHRATPDGGDAALPRWARAVGLRADPRLPRARTPRLEPVRRSWFGAFWQARIGVQAGMSLDDFLRSRLARYLAGLPVPRTRLPLVIEIDDGKLRVTAAAAPPPLPPPPDGCDAWLAPLVALEGPSVRQEVAELEIRIATLDGDIETARRRAEERGRQLAGDVAAGIVTEPPDVEATAEQLGRPPIRSGAPRVLALAFAAAALVAETWQVAQPLLRAAGVDPAALRAEAARRPAEVLFAAIFALAVGTGIFALTHAGLAAGLELFRGDADDRRRRWLASAALGAGLLAALIAAAVASLPSPDAGLRPPTAAFVLLLVAVPLAAALVVQAARAHEEQRAVELAAALAWDRERARSLGERARRLEELTWAEDEALVLERQRDAARRRLRELNARAVAAARITAEGEQRERAALARLAQELVGALELDRYEFVRQASARGAHDLIASRRRKGSDSDSPVGPDATTEPHIQPAGRLAS